MSSPSPDLSPNWIDTIGFARVLRRVNSRISDSRLRMASSKLYEMQSVVRYGTNEIIRALQWTSPTELSRIQHDAQTLEQPIVVEHPMESRGADDDIKYAAEGQVKQIAGKQMNTRPKVRRKMFAGGLQHVVREIDTYDTSTRQGLEQIRGKPSCAAPSVQNEFVTAK